MDPSALIFVALAVAWAVYLIPKALEHHDEGTRSRTVSTFSHTMRVLARREPTSGRTTRLVAGAATPAAQEAVVEVETSTTGVTVTAAAAGRTRRRRSSAARRRNVLALILLATAAVAGSAGAGLIGWPWVAAPAAVLVAWLVACRLMVRRERSVRRPMAGRRPAEKAAPTAGAAEVETDAERTGEAAVAPVLSDETTDIPAVVTGRWDPVDVPLPTYVSKPPAVRRTVRTIDLDSTGVWSSGRSEVDSALAREADAARRDARDARDDQAERRATGS